jgi:hypothetical protein
VRKALPDKELEKGNQNISDSFFYLQKCYLSGVAFNLNQAGVVGKSAAGGHGIFGEDIDTAAVVDAVIIRMIPGAGIQADNPGHDTVGYFRRRAQSAARIVNDHPVSC